MPYSDKILKLLHGPHSTEKQGHMSLIHLYRFKRLIKCYAHLLNSLTNYNESTPRQLQRAYARKCQCGNSHHSTLN